MKKSPIGYVHKHEIAPDSLALVLKFIVRLDADPDVSDLTRIMVARGAQVVREKNRFLLVLETPDGARVKVGER